LDGSWVPAANSYAQTIQLISAGAFAEGVSIEFDKYDYQYGSYKISGNTVKNVDFNVTTNSCTSGKFYVRFNKEFAPKGKTLYLTNTVTKSSTGGEPKCFVYLKGVSTGTYTQVADISTSGTREIVLPNTSDSSYLEFYIYHNTSSSHNTTGNYTDTYVFTDAQIK
jgi:hypothetical protein